MTASQTNQFEIEDNIPLPSISGATSKYPFKTLQVGQSFFVPNLGEEPALLRRRVSAAMIDAKRGPGKFASRTVDGGLRVWRTA